MGDIAFNYHREIYLQYTGPFLTTFDRYTVVVLTLNLKVSVHV